MQTHAHPTALIRTNDAAVHHDPDRIDAAPLALRPEDRAAPLHAEVDRLLAITANTLRRRGLGTELVERAYRLNREIETANATAREVA